MSKIRTISQLLDALRHGYTIADGEPVSPKHQRAAARQEKAEREFCIELAGFSIGIHSMYSEVYDLCEGYYSSREPQIRIDISEGDIAYERAEADPKTTLHSDSYLETLAVYRKIGEALLMHDTVLMHGAVIAYHNEAYMFTANSGTGKTTHINQWLERLPDAFVVNGDKPLIRFDNGRVYTCGTPWCGKEQMNTNAVVPLKAVVLMERGDENIIQQISFGQAFPFLLQQTYRPRTSEGLQKTIALLSELSGEESFYRFSFNNMKEDCFDVAFGALAGETK